MKNKVNLEEFLENAEREHAVKIVFVTVSGSRLYGTDNANSDTDYKGIFIPSAQSVLLKHDPKSISYSSGEKNSKNEADDIDITLHSVYEFFNHLMKSETGSIDLLFSMFSDKIVFEDEYFTSLVKEHYMSFMNKNMKSFIGYALGQTKKFGIKGARFEELTRFVEFLKELNNTGDEKLKTLFPVFEKFFKEQNFNFIKMTKAPGPKGARGVSEIEEYVSVLGKLFHENMSIEYFQDKIYSLFKQFGNRTRSTALTEDKVDYKALSHALRVASEVEELLETNFIKFPLKDAEFLREVKEGKHNYEEVVSMVEDKLEKVDELLLSTDLPEKANIKKIEELLIELILNKG